jgi:signal transduction histidine kinase
MESKDAYPSNSARGLGISGMQERIELLGGELDINTAPGNGTHIHIRVPLEERSLVND